MLLITLATLISSAVAAGPPFFILAGDSTTAVGGGWGDGFLGYVSEGQNIAKGGATTVSFRSGGYWDTVMGLVNDNVGSFEPLVTIQFGHNDQKEEAGISLEQFQQNMMDLANEVLAAGGTPVW